MEDILERILGYRTLSASKAHKLHHLSQTPPEYWTAKERVLSGKARTRWLREERKRASRGGSPAILDHIWPTGPYWPNGGVLVGGEKRRKEFRKEVGRMRYRDQEVSLPSLTFSYFLITMENATSAKFTKISLLLPKSYKSPQPYEPSKHNIYLYL